MTIRTPLGVMDRAAGRLLSEEGDASRFRDSIVTMSTTGLPPCEDTEGSAELVPDPRWAEFVMECCCGRRDLYDYLHRALGYACLGSGERDLALVLYGPTTRNGKTVLMDAVANAMGDYAWAAPPELVCASGRRRDSGSADESLASLRGRRLVTVSELPQGAVMDSAKVKAITGHSTISVRGIYEHQTTFAFGGTLVLDTNYLPAVTDGTVFESGRVAVVPFDNHVPEERRDETLRARFANARGATTILWWLLDGYQEYLRDGLDGPPEVREATTRWRYGFWGIALVQTLTFFPVCYMMFRGLLKNIDPSLEEAARDMGASRWKVFTSVTFPLILPGLGNAFLVTFIESIADFANPMLIGGSYDTLATSIYLQITGAYDKQGAAAMAVVLLFITLVMLVVQKYVLEAKSTATLTGKASRARMLITDASVRIPLTILCAALAIFVVMMYVCVPFGALFRTWGYDFTLTTKWFKQVFTMHHGLEAFRDSFVLSLVASPITALLSMIISYLVVKRSFRAKGFIEAVSMLAMAVPGTVLGVGYIRGFSGGIFHTGVLQGLYGTGAILVIVFIVRSLPTGTRSGISALRQIDKSIEESAYDMGANSLQVFMTVTLPLIKDSFLSGLVTAFVRSITAISAIILLVTPQFLLITVQINEFAEKGAYGVACAFATILIIITYGAVLLMNLAIKRFGTSAKLTTEVEG